MLEYHRTTGVNKVTSIHVIALDAGNGKQLWIWTSEPGMFNPQVNANLIGIAGYNGVIYIKSDLGLFAISGSDGHILWHALQGTAPSSFGSPSVPDQN